MIWATFESQYNSPDATYSYLNSNFNVTTNQCPPNTNCITTVPLSTSDSTPTLFYNGNPGAAVAPSAITETATSSTLPNGNIAITFSSASIMPNPPHGIPTLAPTSVVRLSPWGNEQPATPTITDRTVINNTLLISLQASVGSQLTQQGRNGPILATYVQGGAIWTNGQVPPPSPPSPPQFGSRALANTTMETFQQFTQGSLTQAPAVQPAANCFGCHTADNPPPFSASNPGATLSHIFPQPTQQ